MKRKLLVLMILGVILIAVISWRFLQGRSELPTPVFTEVPLVEVPEQAPVPVATPTPIIEKKKIKPAPANVPTLAAPPVQLHKELIPKDVEIVRVYYASSISAPGSSVEFDINGSGFTSQFEQMIKTESGHSDVSIKNLALRTPNQIHGTLVANNNAATALAFPRVLIKGKVVFQAPEPFAIIRPGEVLNLIFLEMGESGRTGRFRVFTNLTPEMLNDFKIQASTPVIQVGDLTPALPFIVDGSIIIGPAAGGEYGLQVKLKDKVLWSRDGIVRVVRPNVGQSGLVQRIRATDGFHRPGDKAVFLLQGSGFRPEDTRLLSVQVSEMDVTRSTFVYLAPGRMELAVWIPDQAASRSYGLAISQDKSILLETKNAFTVVSNNWLREVGVQPSLQPGDSGRLILRGRDLDASFVSNIKIQVDESELIVGDFVWDNPEQGSAPIQVGSKVKPGDYLLHLSLKGTPLTAQFGNIIRIEAPVKKP